MSGRLPPLLAAAAASRGPRPGRGGPWTVVVRAATPTLREKAVDWHIVGVSVAMMGPCASPRPAGGWYLSHRTAESGCGLGRFDGSALLLPPRASPAPPFPAGLAAPPRPSMPSPLPRRTGSGRRRGKGGAFPPPRPTPLAPPPRRPAAPAPPPSPTPTPDVWMGGAAATAAAVAPAVSRPRGSARPAQRCWLHHRDGGDSMSWNGRLRPPRRKCARGSAERVARG